MNLLCGAGGGLSRILATLAMFAGFSMVAGCDPQATGFALPPGDAETGKRVFVELRCNDCHSVADIAHAASSVGVEHLGKETTGTIHVALGGKTSRSQTYGQLVTSVINPSHEISTRYARHLATTQSPMRNYNDVMTVQNLIDIVAFLQEEYDVTPPRSTYYEPSSSS